jgi:type II secretory ATPase GspE/PulE/Tfp pilus assembly ATPase PilB-like protein
MEQNLHPKTRLVHQLVSTGLVTEPQLDLALREQRRVGGHLGQILVDLGFLEPEALSNLLAEKATAHVVNLNRAAIEPDALELVPMGIARRHRVMPISRNGHTIRVAMSDPFDVVAIDTLHQVTGLEVEVVTAPERDILNSQDLYYASGATIEESIDQILEEKAKEDARPIEEILTRLGDTEDDAPVIRLVSQIISRAIHRGVSDIHFEPEERLMRIRTRVDGVLFPDVLIPKTMQSAVCTRMKILADLDVSETRIPQDGRATVLVGGRQVNLRVSSLPTAHGENIVARILDPSSQVLTLASLGFAPDTEKAFRGAINKPYGVVLVTGPTGSGKTTTLYAVLHEVASMEVSTFTLEDPIEYRMPLVRQTQIKEDVGMTFGNGLRALLRQDPDIILVGETRDTETAQLMIRAALTGHLVFSTLHTNDAAGAIPRLVDMGVEPYLLPASLLAVLAQRLVRTICKHCKEEIQDAERHFAEAGVQPPAGQPPRLWRGKGCPACRNTGYKGRQGVYELMVIDERFHDPIVHRSGAPEFVRLGRERGMRTMFEDGVVKAAQGLTTIEELMRVIRLDDNH